MIAPVFFICLCFQKVNVFVNGRPAQITNSCQFADVEVSALVGGVVPEKSRRKAICGRPICFPFALAIATPDRNSLWTWFVGRDWDSNPISTPYATTAKPHHLSQNPPTFSVYIPVFPTPLLVYFGSMSIVGVEPKQNNYRIVSERKLRHDFMYCRREFFF